MSNTTTLHGDIAKLGLEQYALELEADGLTIVPPEVTGINQKTIDHCIEALLEKFTEMTGGCPINLEDGPTGNLSWPKLEKRTSLRPKDAPRPTQMLIQQLLQIDRCFRDLCVNPVVDLLIGHLFGYRRDVDHRAWRLSSTNSFVKWQGDFGYGEHLGLHCDQGGNPLPWGATALTANATWALTNYTKEDGALAYVPGTHKAQAHPNHPYAARRAIAAECKPGSVIIWPGSTWHGAFPKKTRGLRLNAVAYYRHQSVLPQENLKVTMKDVRWDDCDNPDVMRSLIGFDDEFPYEVQSQPVPQLAAG